MTFRRQFLLGISFAAAAVVFAITYNRLDDWDARCLPGLMLLIPSIACGGVALILLGWLQHKHEFTHPTHQRGKVPVVVNPVGGLLILWGSAAFIAIPFMLVVFCTPESRNIRKGIQLGRLAKELVKEYPDQAIGPGAGMYVPKWVDFSNTALTDPHCTCLGDATTLERVKLDGTQVTDAGLCHLRGLPALRELSLSLTAITDAGLEHLMTLPVLEELDISYTQVTDVGLKMLSRHPTLRFEVDPRNWTSGDER